MGTKLNKKNEKRKNIHRIIAGTRYKNEIISNKSQTHQLAPRPSPKGRGVITEIPARMMTKLRHRHILNAPTTFPVLNMSLKNMPLCHSGLTLSILYMAFYLAFCIFICMKKPQDINGLKKNHYLCNRISYPKK